MSWYPERKNPPLPCFNTIKEFFKGYSSNRHKEEMRYLPLYTSVFPQLHSFDCLQRSLRQSRGQCHPVPLATPNPQQRLCGPESYNCTKIWILRYGKHRYVYLINGITKHGMEWQIGYIKYKLLHIFSHRLPVAPTDILWHVSCTDLLLQLGDLRMLHIIY